MKKIKKLGLQQETIRVLSAATLAGAAGGLSGARCSAVQTGCAECNPHPSITNSVCQACATDICTFVNGC